MNTNSIKQYMTSTNLVVGAVSTYVLYRFVIRPKIEKRRMMKQVMQEMEAEKGQATEGEEKTIEEMNADSNDGAATANFKSSTTTAKFIAGKYPGNVLLSNPPRRNDRDSSTLIM